MTVAAASRRGNESDDYKTPPMCIHGLIERVKISKEARILDPCSGSGVFGKVFRHHGYTKITEYDKETDFMQETRKFDYVIMNNNGYRAGTMNGVWSGDTVSYNEYSTSDIGTTSGVTLSIVSETNNIILRSDSDSDNWNIKLIIKII